MTTEGKKCKLREEYCRTAQILLLVAGIMLIFVGISMIFLAPHLINREIRQRKNFEENSELNYYWENPDYKYRSEIFVFSVNNSHQILDGNKPEVVQIGPYVYDVHSGRNIVGYGNRSVKYQSVQSFIFDRNASCEECSLHKKIEIPNIIFQKFAELSSNPVVSSIAHASLTSSQPFIKISVDDALFKGYVDPFLKNVCAMPLVDIICKSWKVPDKIGFMLHKNGAQKVVEASIGSEDGSIAAGELLKWDGLNLLPENWWNSKHARKINGSDGGLYKPLIEKTDVIYVFAPDICRSIHLTFAEEFEYKGIPAYRFTVMEDLLDPAVPGNEGFCHDDGRIFFSEDEKCLPKGLLDLSHCYSGKPPVIFSFPNFLYADERIKKSVIGLNESSVEHDSITLEIEPRTGTLLRIYIRYQINIAILKDQKVINDFIRNFYCLYKHVPITLHDLSVKVSASQYINDPVIGHISSKVKSIGANYLDFDEGISDYWKQRYNCILILNTPRFIMVLSKKRSTIVPLLAEFQVVEIGNGSLTFLRRMLRLIKMAFAFLCFIPIAVGILFISVALFIKLHSKTRLMNKIMECKSNKVTVQVQSLPDNQKNISFIVDKIH